MMYDQLKEELPNSMTGAPKEGGGRKKTRRKKRKGRKTRKKQFLYNPNNPKFGYPKGHKEVNETDEYCASREAREETGLNLNINKKDPFIKINNSIYFVYSLFNDNIKFNHIFICWSSVIWFISNITYTSII